jgi:hypothetical protein
MAEPTLDERVRRIEQLLERAIATARQSAVGRSILARLGLK